MWINTDLTSFISSQIIHIRTRTGTITLFVVSVPCNVFHCPGYEQQLSILLRCIFTIRMQGKKKKRLKMVSSSAQAIPSMMSIAFIRLILAREGTFCAGIRWICERKVPMQTWEGGFALKCSHCWLDLISIPFCLHISTLIIASQTGGNITRQTFAPLWNAICDNEFCVCQMKSS